MECGDELEDIAQQHFFEWDNKEIIVCEKCIEKVRKLISKQRELNHSLDDDKKRKFQYVNIANPIKLGIYIGIGIFIVLPLLVFGVIILLAIFMVIFGYSLGSLISLIF